MDDRKHWNEEDVSNAGGKIQKRDPGIAQRHSTCLVSSRL